jgi:hypothetical protein
MTRLGLSHALGASALCWAAAAPLHRPRFEGPYLIGLGAGGSPSDFFAADAANVYGPGPNGTGSRGRFRASQTPLRVYFISGPPYKIP